MLEAGRKRRMLILEESKKMAANIMRRMVIYKAAVPEICCRNGNSVRYSCVQSCMRT